MLHLTPIQTARAIAKLFFLKKIGRWLLWRENYIAVRLAGVGKKTGLRHRIESIDQLILFCA
jgi:hypothetical protein